MRNGLSTATAIDGALRGAQQMSNLIDSHKRRGLMDAQAERAEESHDARMKGARQHQNFQQEKMDDYRSERRKQQEEEAKRAFMLSGMARARAVDRGDFSKEDLELIERYPLADVEYLQSEEVGKALGALKSVMAGESKLPYNEQGAIDLSQNPELADALMALDPKLGRGNKDGKKVRPHYLIPSEDGKSLRVGLDVDGDDKVRPLTVNRSSADDDPVMEIQTADLINSIMAAERARELSSQPEFYQYLMEVEGMAVPGQQSKGFSDPEKHEELGWVQRGADGRLHPLNAGAGGKGADGRSELPAKAQMIEYYKAAGYDEEDAIHMANSSVSSREKFAQDYSKMLLETYKDSFTDDGQPALTPGDAIQQALDVYDQNFRRTPKSSGQESPRAAAPATEFGRQAGAMLDGGVPVPMRPQKQAPPAAIERLKADLQAGDQAALQEFEEYFGYVPDGI